MAVDSQSDCPFPWSNSCRLCLTQHNIALNIFENDNTLSNIKTCMNTIIYSGDPMPRMICLECLGRVDAFCTFRASCKDTENKLRNLLEDHSADLIVQEYLHRFEGLMPEKNCELPIASTDLPSVQKIVEENNVNRLQNTDHESEACFEEGEADDMQMNGLSTNSTGKADVNSISPEVQCGTVDSQINLPLSSQPHESCMEEASNECFTSTTHFEVSQIDLNRKTGHDSSEATPLFTMASDLILHPSDIKREVLDPNVSSVEDETLTERVDVFIKTEPETDGNIPEAGNTKPSVVCDDIVNGSDDSYDRSYNLRPRRDLLSITYNADLLDNSIETPFMSQKPKITPWKCVSCDIYFTTKNSQIKHYATPQCLSNHKESFTCSVCSRLFISLNDLADHQVCHMRIAHQLTESDLIGCKLCDLKFSDTYTLSKHTVTHKPEEKVIKPRTQYPCSDCDQVFMSKPSYSAHLQQCFKPGGQIESVKLKVQAPREFACSLCPKRYSGEDLLYDHRFGYHGIPDERVTCEVCGLKFRDPAKLHEHSKIHSVSSPTARKSTFSSKARSSGTGRVRCRQCGRFCSSPEELSKHEALKHKDPTVHCCRKCSRKFTSRSLLLIHHRTHCSKTEKIVNAPIRTGPNATPESACLSCKIKFHTKFDFEYHMQRHEMANTNCILKFRSSVGGHLIYKYHCSLCPQLFCTKHSMTGHRRKVHFGSEIRFTRLKESITRSDLITQTNESVLKSGSSLTGEVKQTTPKKSGATPDIRASFSHQERLSSKTLKCSSIPSHSQVDSGHFSSETILKCQHCPRILKTKYHKVRHEKLHDPENPTGFLCAVCKRHIPDFEKYTKHRKACHATKPLPMKISHSNHSPLTPPSSSSSDSFKAMATLGKMCPICKNSYENSNSLELHIITVHGADALQRLTTQYHPTSVNAIDFSLDIRNKIVQNINGMYFCTLCQLSLRDNEAVAQHQARHPRGNLYIISIGKSLYLCTACDMVFSSSDIAFSHARFHSEQRLKLETSNSSMFDFFNCPFCSSTFASEEGIRNHMFFVHPGGGTEPM